MDTTDEFENLLSGETEASHPPPAERLTAILRGMFDCLQDLNQRLADLEAGAEGGGC